MTRSLLSLPALVLLAACAMQQRSGAEGGMSFFVTSSNPGRGADFGGLEGADAHCQALAAAAGAGGRTWHAYLSSNAQGGAINARDRIGHGPWRNAKGIVIASDVEQLHGANSLDKQTALTEKGEVVNGRGDTPNMHDILTGTQADGRAFTSGNDVTCGNWSQSGEGSAIVGHHDRVGVPDTEKNRSWNSAHPTRGCGLDALRSTGGAGLLYCFAVN